MLYNNILYIKDIINPICQSTSRLNLQYLHKNYYFTKNGNQFDKYYLTLLRDLNNDGNIWSFRSELNFRRY